MRPKKNFWVVIFLFLVLLIFQVFIKDNSIERTIYFLLILLVSSAYLTSRSTDKFILKRSTRETRQQVGQYFVENYEIENNKPLPIVWLRVFDESNITAGKEKKIIAWVPGYGRKSFVQQGVLEYRGVFSLGPTKVISGDPFGLFSKTITFQSISKIVILPKYQKLDYFPEPSGFLTGGSARKTRNAEVSPYAISVRDYLPGDPLKRIAWKTSARLEKLMVKEFEDDPQSTVWIFLDGDANYLYVDEQTKYNNTIDNLWKSNEKLRENFHKNSFELQVSAAASICDFYISDGRFVGFFGNGQQQVSISPEGGVRQLDKVLEMLASIQIAEKNNITEHLLSQINKVSKGSTIVILTSNQSTEFIETIKKLQKRNFSIILVATDPESFNQQSNQNFFDNLGRLGIKTIKLKNGEPVQEKQELG
jgi:uncharacterized protein (DUF58 family)